MYFEGRSGGSRFEVAALYRGADGHLRRTRMVATLHARGMDGFDLDDVRHEADETGTRLAHATLPPWRPADPAPLMMMSYGERERLPICGMAKMAEPEEDRGRQEDRQNRVLVGPGQACSSPISLIGRPICSRRMRSSSVRLGGPSHRNAP